MWPFRQKQNEVITISLTPQNIICSLIEAPKKNEITYKLNAYKRIPLKQFEFSQAIVFNTKIIKHHITSFLKTVAKKKVSCCTINFWS
ncbi:hypothetical protein KAH94_03680, partial [bacterium]|nr:hypothetical protein [bacterium]